MVAVNSSPLEILQSVTDEGHGRGMSAVHDYIFVLNGKNKDEIAPELDAAFKRAVLDATGEDFGAVKTVQEFVQSEVDQGRYVELLSDLGRDFT